MNENSSEAGLELAEQLAQACGCRDYNDFVEQVMKSIKKLGGLEALAKNDPEARVLHLYQQYPTTAQLKKPFAQAPDCSLEEMRQRGRQGRIDFRKGIRKALDPLQHANRKIATRLGGMPASLYNPYEIEQQIQQLTKDGDHNREEAKRIVAEREGCSVRHLERILRRSKKHSQQPRAEPALRTVTRAFKQTAGMKPGASLKGKAPPKAPKGTLLVGDRDGDGRGSGRRR